MARRCNWEVKGKKVKPTLYFTEEEMEKIGKALKGRFVFSKGEVKYQEYEYKIKSKAEFFEEAIRKYLEAIEKKSQEVEVEKV